MPRVVPHIAVVGLVILVAATFTARMSHAADLTELPSCPFSRWQGEPRYCYECRWCPFRSRTCCEMEDEIDVLKSVNVSGSDDWDCFITIVHFQQCGRCSPSAKTYVQQKQIDYVWEDRGLSIRPCQDACRYIYKQCNGASLLDGQPVVKPGQSIEDFCRDAPEKSTPQVPCYNAASRFSLGLCGSIALLVVCAFVAVLLP